MHPSLFSPIFGRLFELRRTWYLALAIVASTYFYLLANFPIGNHDWARMDGLAFYSYQVELGRWMAPAVFSLTWFKQLPVASALWAIVAQVTAGMLTAYFLEVALLKRIAASGYLLAAVLSSVIPFFTWGFGFSWMAAFGPISQLLCILGLIVALSNPGLRGAAVGANAIFLSMAIYQSTINTAAVLFWAACVMVVAGGKAGSSIRSSLPTLSWLAGAIMVGAVLYKVSLKALTYFGLLANTYHFDFLTLDRIPGRIVEIVRASFEHLLVAHPFFPASLKLFLLVLCGVGSAMVVGLVARSASSRKDATVRVLLSLIALFLLVVSTKIQFLVSAQEKYFINRYASFGVTYVYLVAVVSASTLITGKLRTLFLAACWVCVSGLIAQNLAWQDSYVKQNDYDHRFINRVIGRIELTEGFSYAKQYDFILVGGIKNIRRELFHYEGKESANHRTTIIPPWTPHLALTGLEPRIQINKSIRLPKKPSQVSENNRNKIRALYSYIDGVKPWPDESSVSIFKNTIVVVLGKGKGYRRNRRAWK